MKLLKTTISKSKYVLLALLVAFSFSCNPEDGENGADGATGLTGSNGENGNANVQNITFDATTFSGSFDNVSIAELTQDVLDNDAILVYLNTGTVWFPVPCPADSFQFDHAVDVNFAVGSVTLDYSDGSGNAASITAGNLASGRVIIIESTNTTAARLNTTQKVFFELNSAGIDINDYQAVCNYYGISK